LCKGNTCAEKVKTVSAITMTLLAPYRLLADSAPFSVWQHSKTYQKKGRPSAATSHESRPGKPSFALSVFARGNSFGARTDNSIDNGLGKLLGYYPNIQHEMLHTDVAQQRPGNLPSAPQASQKPLRAQNQANGRTTNPAIQLRQNSQPEPWTQHTSA